MSSQKWRPMLHSIIQSGGTSAVQCSCKLLLSLFVKNVQVMLSWNKDSGLEESMNVSRDDLSLTSAACKTGLMKKLEGEKRPRPNHASPQFSCTCQIIAFVSNLITVRRILADNNPCIYGSRRRSKAYIVTVGGDVAFNKPVGRTKCAHLPKYLISICWPQIISA